MMWILVACVLAYATKLVGYMLPERLLNNDHVLKVAGSVTVGLLASLIAVNAFGNGTELSLDARVGALIVAIIGCALRAPFLLVVVLGAASAAALRALGWG